MQKWDISLHQPHLQHEQVQPHLLEQEQFRPCAFCSQIINHVLYSEQLYISYKIVQKHYWGHEGMLGGGAEKGANPNRHCTGVSLTPKKGLLETKKGPVVRTSRIEEL